MEKPHFPEEVLKQVEFKISKPKPIEKTVNIIWDKGQALIRFPTKFNDELGLEKGDKFKLTIDSSKTPPELICRLIKASK